MQQHAYANQPSPHIMQSAVNRAQHPRPMPPAKHVGPLPAGPMLPQYSGPSPYINMGNSISVHQAITQQQSQYNSMQSHGAPPIKNGHPTFNNDRVNVVPAVNPSHNQIANTSPPPPLPTLPKPNMQMQQSSAQNNGVNNMQLSTQNLPPHYESQQLSPQANAQYTAQTVIVDRHERSMERLPVSENDQNQVQQSGYHQSYENLKNGLIVGSSKDARSNQMQSVHCSSSSPNQTASNQSPSVNVTNIPPVEESQVNNERSYSNQQEIVMMNQNNQQGNHQINQTAAQREHQQR